jgi:hypothetical protein
VDLGLKASCNNFEIDGSGSIQIPFTISNPTYGKSLDIEREAQGMGLVFMNGIISVARINTVNNNLGLTAVGDISLSTGLANTVKGVPVVNSFSCSDETTAITTTGIKTSIRIAQTIQLYKIKVSLNTLSGGLSVILRLSGIQFASIPMTTNLIVSVTSAQLLTEDDLVTAEVSGTGANTGTGLKVYLVGKTD